MFAFLQEYIWISIIIIGITSIFLSFLINIISYHYIKLIESQKKIKSYFLNDSTKIKRWIYKNIFHIHSKQRILFTKKTSPWLGIKQSMRLKHHLFFYLVIFLCIFGLNLMTFLRFGWTIKTLCVFYFIFLTMIISVIDFKEKFVPSMSIFFLLGSGLIINSFQILIPPIQAILGCFIGYISLKIFQKIYYWFTSRDGIGEGDVQLAAVLGAWLGPQCLPMLLLLSSVMVMIVSIIRLPFSKTHLKTIIPFGPYLSFSSWLLMVFPIAFFGLRCFS